MMFKIFKKTLEKTTQNIRDLLPKTQKKLSKEALEEITGWMVRHPELLIKNIQ